MYEDTCGNCWLPYCYNYVSHEVSYDIDESDCVGQSIWVIPGDDSDPYYDNYCNGYCPDNFLLDDCGSCWKNFCYTFFSLGLNDDPIHSVYYDLNASECESYGYSYYEADHPSSPHWNSNCSDDVVDDGGDDGSDDECSTCLEGCVSYVMNNYGYEEAAAYEWCSTTPNANYGCADTCIDDCSFGDVNDDNIVNVVDLVEIVSFILETDYPSDQELCASDVNLDNVINVVDVVEIVSFILNEN